MPEQKAPLTILGFDYGTRFIGLAVGQNRTGSANPLPAIAVRQGKPDWDTIGRVINEWQPDRLIIGYPLNMFDEEQDMSTRAQRFSRQLNGRFGLPTEMIDERLTTREAYAQCAQPGRMDKQEIDSISAVLIAESWLAEQGRGTG